jgi:hypothetical protein
MIPDHKMLAAGDETEAQQPPKMNVVDPYAPIDTYDKVRLVTCKRCAKLRPYFGLCKGCEDLKTVPCFTCHKPLGDHTMEYGSRARRRLWKHPANPFLCRPENDPIKQRAIPQDAPKRPRIIWEDIIEEK